MENQPKSRLGAAIAYLKKALNALPFMVLFSLAILVIIEIALILGIIWEIGQPHATGNILSMLFFMTAMGGILFAAIKIGAMQAEKKNPPPF